MSDSTRAVRLTPSIGFALLSLALAPLSAPAAAQSEAGPFAGVWNTNFGELRLHQSAEYVVGDYGDQGVLVGRASGDCVAGVFTNEGRSGVFRWHRRGGRSFRGQWAWHGEPLSGTWRGRRTATSVGAFTNFTRDGSTIRSVDNDRRVWDGIYATSHGTVRLRARDLFLVGDYADRGVIAGMWDGRAYVGRFTNGARVGWFRFPSNSASGSFGEGAWGWIGDEGGGPWRLTEQSDATPRLTNMIDDVRCGGAAGEQAADTQPAEPAVAAQQAADAPAEDDRAPEIRPATVVLAGEWSTNNGDLRLHQFDGYVVGDYAHRGIVLGRVSGNCVAGVFTNGDQAGIFRWRSTGGQSFQGQWGTDSLTGDWNGTRSSGGVGDFRNFSRDGSRTTLRINDRTVWNGSYDSTHGRVKLVAEDLFLIGDYADRGIIAGMWNGNAFVGRFTNGSRVGWFVFPSDSGSGTFRSGNWGWVEGDGDREGQWNLRKTRGHTPTLTNMLDDVRCD